MYGAYVFRLHQKWMRILTELGMDDLDLSETRIDELKVEKDYVI